MDSIYLGSGSPRRRELLALMDIPFERLIIDVEEQRQPEEAPLEYVCRLAAGQSACRR
jgi:predicted house-cleaning NTP pyrophosphatase (Maf/HAM1 superfamily)